MPVSFTIQADTILELDALFFNMGIPLSIRTNAGGDSVSVVATANAPLVEEQDPDAITIDDLRELMVRVASAPALGPGMVVKILDEIGCTALSRKPGSVEEKALTNPSVKVRMRHALVTALASKE